jgi:cbb3-type cytochrome oxidase maturation protein
MDILYLLVPLSVVLVFAIGAVFWLALRGGQFDDLEAPAFQVLADDDSPAFDADQIRPGAPE